MKFVVSRTSVWGDKPREEATRVKATWIDRRKANSIEEAKRELWFEDWYNSTTNHREERGFVAGDSKGEKDDIWVIELKTLEDFIAFVEKYEQAIIKQSFYKEYPYEVEIYDEKRE